MYNKSISLIILSYNDGDSLPKLTKDAFDVLSAHFSQFEVIISDDGSLKETKNTIELLKEQYPSLIVAESPKNLGVGANFNAGLKYCRHETVAYMDGDGQYSPADLIKLFERLKTNNMVSGRRVVRNDSLIRKFVSSMYNTLLRLLYGLKMHDVNSGIKLYNRTIFNNFTCQSIGPFFDAEIVLQHLRNNFEVTEVPVSHYKRKFGRAHGISAKNLKQTFNELFSDKNDELVPDRFVHQYSYRFLKLFF